MREVTYAQAIKEALEEEMERDPRVFILGEDIQLGLPFGATKGLYERFGSERVINTPISENGFVGVAVGAALTGMRPVVDIMFSNLMWLAMEQIANQAAKARYMSGGQASVPLVIRSANGIWGSFAAQHSDSLDAVVMNIPGLTVVAPSCPRDAKGLLKTSIRYDGPVIFLEHKQLYTEKGPVPDEEELIPLSVARVTRSGSDVTVVAVAAMVGKALQAAELLSRESVDVEVVDPRTLAPMDTGAILQSVRRTGRLVVVEEGPRTCGVGAEVAAVVAQEGLYDLDAPIVRVAALPCPVPFSPPLEQYVVPGVDHIVAAVRSTIRR
jgi:pyruvate dehydrogenase E1 component beta subunit